MSRFTPVEKSVIQVLAYAAVFGDSVPVDELPLFQQTPWSVEQLGSARESLLQKKVIVQTARAVDSEILKTKWHSVSRAIQFLSRFPTVESVWVTGGLAIGNIRETDDVDLMIITAPHSLWLTRTVVSICDLLQRRIRRRGDHDERLKDKWCCNLWLDSGYEELEQNQRSLYSAREVIQAIPVYERSLGLVRGFLARNKWAAKYFPVGYRSALLRAQKVRTSSQPSLWFPPVVNHFLYSLHTWRMRSYLQHEIVELHRAFFHPGERAKEVQAKYEKIVESVFSTRK